MDFITLRGVSAVLLVLLGVLLIFCASQFYTLLIGGAFICIGILVGIGFKNWLFVILDAVLGSSKDRD